MIIAINYSDETYRQSQHYNSKTAIRHGADKVIEYTPDMLDEQFVAKNSSILTAKRGNGYWLWKPYVILDALKKAQEGDYIIYTDAGSAYVDDIKKLIDTMEQYNQVIMSFTLDKIEKEYTKRDAFVIMDCDTPKYTDSFQRIGGYVLVKKNDYSVKIIEEWLTYAENKAIISDDPNIMGKENYDCFICNRHDQSIYSLLSKKYDLLPFRDPSQFGLDSQYQENVGSELIKRSTYPQIIDSHRLKNCKHFYQLSYRRWYKWIDPDRSSLLLLVKRIARKIKKISLRLFLGEDE